jgi:hypothetical protein
VISGIYVVAHDGAAASMMDVFTGSPFLLSQMSSARGVTRTDFEQFTAQHRSNYRSGVRWLVDPFLERQKGKMVPFSGRLFKMPPLVQEIVAVSHGIRMETRSGTMRTRDWPPFLCGGPGISCQVFQLTIALVDSKPLAGD